MPTLRISLLVFFSGLVYAQTPGGIRAYPTGAEPACDPSSRGSVIVSLGNKGQPDLLKVCTRDGIGRFAWHPAGQQNTNTYTETRFVGGCPLFPDDNVWNSRADRLPIDPGSPAIIGTYRAARVGVDTSMSINLANGHTPVPPLLLASPESDNGRYPITPDMKVEGYGLEKPLLVTGGPYPGDAHFLVIQTDECKLYEIYSFKSTQPPYKGESGAIFDLLSNDLRPDGWTSSDAAGLPIWPGVLTYAEIYGDAEIRHMIRFTVNRSRNSYVWPARHHASRSGDPTFPPMGSRWRLRAGFDDKTCRSGDLSGGSFPPQIQRILRALKTYGMILADNGSAIMLTADADPRWGDPRASDSPVAVVNGWTHCLTGRDFEVVNASPLMVSPNSAAVAATLPPAPPAPPPLPETAPMEPPKKPLDNPAAAIPAPAKAPTAAASAAAPPVRAEAAPPSALPSDPVAYAFSQLALGRPADAAKIFTAANFPRDKEPLEVRQAYIETQLQLILASAKSGKNCAAIEKTIESVGADRADLPFTFANFNGFSKAPRFQFYLGLAEFTCRNQKDALQRWSRVAKATAPIDSTDYAFPILAAAILTPAKSAAAIAPALQKLQSAAADKALLLYAEGMLLRAAGKDDEAQKRFSEGARTGSAFVRYLNAAAQFDPPFPH